MGLFQSPIFSYLKFEKINEFKILKMHISSAMQTKMMTYTKLNKHHMDPFEDA